MSSRFGESGSLPEKCRRFRAPGVVPGLKQVLAVLGGLTLLCLGASAAEWSMPRVAAEEQQYQVTAALDGGAGRAFLAGYADGRMTFLQAADAADGAPLQFRVPRSTCLERLQLLALDDAGKPIAAAQPVDLGEGGRGALAAALYQTVLEHEVLAGRMPDAEVGECPYTDCGSLDEEERQAVTWASAHQLMEGTGAETFEPEGAVTREQAAVIFWRLYQRLFDGQRQTYRPGSPAGAVQFSDVSPTRWSREAIQAAAGAGILAGEQDGAAWRFRPTELLTRADIQALAQEIGTALTARAATFQAGPTQFPSWEAAGENAWVLAKNGETVSIHVGHQGVSGTASYQWYCRYYDAALDGWRTEPVEGATQYICTFTMTPERKDAEFFLVSTGYASTGDGWGSSESSRFHVYLLMDKTLELTLLQDGSAVEERLPVSVTFAGTGLVREAEALGNGRYQVAEVPAASFAVTVCAPESNVPYPLLLDSGSGEVTGTEGAAVCHTVRLDLHTQQGMPQRPEIRAVSGDNTALSFACAVEDGGTLSLWWERWAQPGVGSCAARYETPDGQLALAQLSLQPGTQWYFVPRAQNTQGEVWCRDLGTAEPILVTVDTSGTALVTVPDYYAFVSDTANVIPMDAAVPAPLDSVKIAISGMDPNPAVTREDVTVCGLPEGLDYEVACYLDRDDPTQFRRGIELVVTGQAQSAVTEPVGLRILVKPGALLGETAQETWIETVELRPWAEEAERTAAPGWRVTDEVLRQVLPEPRFSTRTVRGDLALLRDGTRFPLRKSFYWERSSLYIETPVFFLEPGDALLGCAWEQYYREQASGWSEPVRVTAGGAIAAIEDRSFRRNTTFGCYVLFLTGDFEPGVYGLEVAGRRTTCIQDDSDRTIGLEIWEDDTAAEFFSQPATLYHYQAVEENGSIVLRQSPVLEFTMPPELTGPY
ncbi:MAG: S-layer homology domain-containing protein [Clostridiales bacterium]|nr:S-layer homology domain-containing protein [Flavonifractor sp.]MDU2195114.1 S-layer homology domain-containing protein [Clostridiales bacterium]